MDCYIHARLILDALLITFLASLSLTCAFPPRYNRRLGVQFGKILMRILVSCLISCEYRTWEIGTLQSFREIQAGVPVGEDLVLVDNGFGKCTADACCCEGRDST